MTSIHQATIDFINDNLMRGDNMKCVARLKKDKDYAKRIKIDKEFAKFVSKVRHSKEKSQRVLHELELIAIENKTRALKIAEFHRKSVTL